ncbi:MAG: sigma 54-interacting transcriptional regulator [Firmicutes bacterium]|nr:sigma 54-interacting transcriptional regulator [Bacillota bacterium]
MDRETSVKELLQKLSRQYLREQGLSEIIGVKAEDISQHLDIHRSNASHYLNRLVKKGEAIKINGRPANFLDRGEVEKELCRKLSIKELIINDLKELTVSVQVQEKRQAENFNKYPFKNLIGYNNSLSKQIEQAKAAVMYPPNGLHTLIVGPTGAGKSLFAHKMYEFAKQMGVIEGGSDFITFNCADYSNNPQLLFSQLFGYTKGAFSGADSDKPGLVEMADGSMLFLDEIHRLPPEGQETLFNLMDYGTFRRLGETKKTREAQVRIVGATTISPDSVLLQTFLRRIPLVIHIPGLDERPLVERMAFIAKFFSQESEKIGVPINVGCDIVRALLLYECPGNIGQLKSDIQLMCALAFVEFSASGAKEIIINNNHIKEQLRKYTKEAFEYNDLLEQFTGKQKKWCRFSSDNISLHSNDNEDIYSDITDWVAEFIDSDVPKEKVNNIMKEEVRSYYDFLQSVGEDEQSIEKVFGKIVSTRIMKITHQVLSKVNFPKGVRISRRLLFFLLSIHLNSAIKRIESGVLLDNSDLRDVDKKSQYYFIAQQIAKAVSLLINKDIPESEIDYIALTVNKVQTLKREESPRVAVVVGSRGERAEQMVKVAQNLLGTDHGTSLILNPQWKPDQYKAAISQTIQAVDEGKGIIFLCSHSSVRDYVKEISIKTGIKVEIISRVSTEIVVEAIRLALEPNLTLNDVANNLMKMTPEGSSLDFNTSKDVDVVVFAAVGSHRISGDVRRKLLNKINAQHIRVVNVFGKDEKELKHNIYNLPDFNNIIAIIGSVDPKVDKPFISLESLSGDEELEKIYSLLKQNKLGNDDTNNVSEKGLLKTIKFNLDRLDSFWSVK